jgi:hypothetical protein
MEKKKERVKIKLKRNVGKRGSGNEMKMKKWGREIQRKRDEEREKETKKCGKRKRETYREM